jgi:hypothetical protein
MSPLVVRVHLENAPALLEGTVVLTREEQRLGDIPVGKQGQRDSTVSCPGAVSNILVGAFAAFSSWAFYGSGASIELADSSRRDFLVMH